MKLRGHFIIYGNQNDSNRNIVDLTALVIKAKDSHDELLDSLQRKHQQISTILDSKQMKEATARLEKATHNLITALKGEEK